VAFLFEDDSAGIGYTVVTGEWWLCTNGATANVRWWQM